VISNAQAGESAWTERVRFPVVEMQSGPSRKAATWDASVHPISRAATVLSVLLEQSVTVIPKAETVRFRRE